MRTPNPIELRFASWAKAFYAREYPQLPHYRQHLTLDRQRDSGDVYLSNDDGKQMNFDEKASQSRWDGCLIELLQDSTPRCGDGKPRSLGWFYDLTKCDRLLYGDYDGIEALEPCQVHVVRLQRLRENYARLSCPPNTRWSSRRSVKGFGVTEFVVAPWSLLIYEGIARRVSMPATMPA